jgi:mannitol-1-phosphate 5-dehydrogenase
VKSKEIKKLVLFGAGKIGRSFVGQLFSRGGYEVVFVDIYQPVIEELNRRNNYNVVIKGDVNEVLNIKNVRGVLADDYQKVINEVAGADILAVSVGIGGLSTAIPLIAKGLIWRYQKDPENPLDIILAENLRNASEYLEGELKKYLPSWYPLEKLVGLVETSIGKMVPIMRKKDLEEDVLQVFAEPYNTLILDKLAFRNPIPEIEGLAPKEHMKPWVDRKLFIHNLGHAAAAYLGFLHNPDFVYIYEVLEVPALKSSVREVMLQSANLLLAKYPEEFTLEAITNHIDDLLFRFQNKALGDTIFRVGCDLKRKLGPDDRLVGAIRMAMELNLPYDKILHVLICGCHFRAKDENGNMFSEDEEFAKDFKMGLSAILKSICNFDEILDKQFFKEAETMGKMFPIGT